MRVAMSEFRKTSDFLGKPIWQTLGYLGFKRNETIGNHLRLGPSLATSHESVSWAAMVPRKVNMKLNYGDTKDTATMNPPKAGRGYEQDKGNADHEEMMRKAEAAGKPGPGHKALEHFVGNWKAEVKCWMEPDGPPHESKGTAKVSWIMKGRFLQEDFAGEMMGKPFQGRSVTGYDNMTQSFNSVWFSDMQTSMFTTQGQGENGNQVITLEGKSSCPATGQTDIPMKVVLRVLGPNKHTFEMFDASRGNAKTMEITYTRK